MTREFLMEDPEYSTPDLLRPHSGGVEAFRQELEKRIVLDRLKLEVAVRSFGLVATLGDGVVWVSQAITPDWQLHRDADGFINHVEQTLVYNYAAERFLKKK